MSHDETSNDDLFEDRTLTRVLNRQFEVEGVPFSWWAVTDKPAFVTVSSRFGSRAALTNGDPESFARELALQLLKERADRLKSVGR